MFTNERITDIGYYHDQEEIAQKEQAEGREGSAMDYYGAKGERKDNGAATSEAKGRWITFGKSSPVTNPKAKDKEQVPEFAKTGDHVSFADADKLAKGFHPATGKPLIQMNRPERTVGYDLQFALPKSASILWGMGRAAAAKGSNEGQRYADAIEEAQAQGVERALRYAYDNGLMIARRSEKRHGHESAAHIAIAQYGHYTSRAGDMQIHTHNVWFNVCIRDDGTTGTIDNALLKKHGGAMAALYRMEAASVIKEKLGVSISKVDRNWEIDGVPEELLTTFNKRQQQIKKAAAELGIEDTANHREASKHINRNTRQKKDEQPPLVELYDRWNMEASSKGWSFQALTENVVETADRKNRVAAEEWAKRQVEASQKGEALPAERPAFDLEEIKAKAYSRLTTHHSVFEERLILREVFEELQVHCDVDTAVKVVDDLIKSGDLVPLSKRGDDLYFSTAEIIEKERAMLKDALSMKGNFEALDPATVERFITDGRLLDNGERGFLREEQARAVRWLCSTSQVAVVQGRAGAGKSFMSGTVADVHRALGREVHAIAPSHKAKEIVRDDAKIAADMARAVAGFIADHDKEKIVLHSKSTILVDEAGMIGLDDMKRLVEIAKASGARFILMGDTKQLQPVTKGAPMAAIANDEVCGAVVLSEIVRQKVLWQRQASVMLSEGKTKEGLSEYIKHGRVKFCVDGDTAKEATVAAYMEDLDKNPNDTRIMSVFRNSHATELNGIVREHLKERGAIKDEGAVIPAWTRGLNQRVVDRQFCEGERIIFGETVNLRDMQIANNSVGTINSIATAEDEEPLFNITLDDGRSFIARPSELVGYRSEDAKDKATPKLDHAYAATVHSLQGATFGRNFTYAGEAGSAELVYVMNTRHKFDCHTFVDAGRIHDAEAANSGTKMFLNEKTGATKENNTEATKEITDEMIREKWLSECAKSSAKLNACDFHDSIKEFIGENVANEHVKGSETAMEENTQERHKKVTPAFLADAQTPFGGRTMPRGLGPIGRKPEENRAGGMVAEAAKTVGEQVRERMEQRAATQKPRGNTSWVEIPKDALDKMVRHDLVEYFQKHHSFSYVEAYQPKDGIEAHILRHEDVGKISVKLKNDNTWTWTTRAGDAAGRIWDYETWRSGGKKGHGIRRVFDNLRMTPDTPPSYSLSNDKGRNVEQKPEPPKTMMDRIKGGDIAKWVTEQLGEVKERWDRMVKNTRETDGVNAYLAGRGIDAETQRLFKGQIGTEHRLSRQNPYGVTIAHRDLDGNVWNYERKGPKHDQTEKRDFSQMGAGTKRLGLLGNHQAPTRIYVSESAIDGISLFQRDGRPQGALIASTFGNPSDEGLRDLHMLARQNPKAEFHLAMDNDKAGSHFTAMMQEVVQLARGEAANVVDRRPDPDFKDWNDQVRGKKWSNAEKSIEERREAALAEDRAKGEAERQARRAEQEEERRRLKEEREASQSRGPTR